MVSFLIFFVKIKTMVKIVSINGNIACGKSTLLKRLRSRGYEVVMEGLNRGKWGSVLEMYYKSPERYGYLFQTLVVAEMKETYAGIRTRQYDAKNGVVFVERSHLDCMAFAKLVYENGHMSREEIETFKRLYDLLLEQPDIVISLDLSPEVCFERCKARARKCESEITLSYLRGVDQFTEMVMEENAKRSNSPVLMRLDVLGKSTNEIVDELVLLLN